MSWRTVRIRLTRKKSHRKTEIKEIKESKCAKINANIKCRLATPAAVILPTSRIRDHGTDFTTNAPTHQRTNEPLANQFKSKLAKGMQREKNDDGSQECFLFLFNSPVSVSDREKSARHFNDSCGHGDFKKASKVQATWWSFLFFSFSFWPALAPTNVRPQSLYLPVTGPPKRVR